MQVQVSTKEQKFDATKDLYKLLAAILLGLILPIPFILGTRLLIPPPRDIQITVIIDRYAETDTDWTAIRTAESTNFSVLFGIPPFQTTSGHTYTPSIQWETWFHYINNHTLAHYLNRTQLGPQYHYNLHITLNYTARCIFASSMQVDILDNTIQVSNGASVTTFHLSQYVDGYDSRWVQWIDDAYTRVADSGIPQQLQGNYGTGYFLYMGLDHHEWWSPVAAFGPHIEQFIILNATYHTLFATAIEEPHWIS